MFGLPSPDAESPAELRAMLPAFLRTVFRGKRLRVEVYSEGTRDASAELSPDDLIAALATPEGGRPYLEIDLDTRAVVLSLTAPEEDP